MKVLILFFFLFCSFPSCVIKHKNLQDKNLSRAKFFRSTVLFLNSSQCSPLQQGCVHRSRIHSKELQGLANISLTSLGCQKNKQALDSQVPGGMIILSPSLFTMLFLQRQCISYGLVCLSLPRQGFQFAKLIRHFSSGQQL